MVEKVEQPNEEQPSAKPAKVNEKKPAKKAKKQKQPKQPKQDDGLYLPVLVEFTFTSSVIILIFVFLAMAAVSWFTGTSLLDFVLRTSAAIGVMGSLLMVVFRQVSTGVLAVSRAEIEEKLEASGPDEPENQDDPVNSQDPEQPQTSEDIENSEGSLRVEIPAISEVQ